MSEQTVKIKRDYSMFDADLSGAVLNVSLLGRLLSWLKPYRGQLVLSSVLVLVASFLNILLPITISLVAIDYIIRTEPTTNAPDFGLIELNDWLQRPIEHITEYALKHHMVDRLLYPIRTLNISTYTLQKPPTNTSTFP